jgi:outer membrane immunogenic protein
MSIGRGRPSLAQNGWVEQGVCRRAASGLPPRRCAVSSAGSGRPVEPRSEQGPRAEELGDLAECIGAAAILARNQLPRWSKELDIVVCHFSCIPQNWACFLRDDVRIPILHGKDALGWGRIMKIKSIAVAACATAFSGSAFAAPPPDMPIGFDPASNSSWLAGAVAGYNWQRGAFVFGFEGDLSGTGLRSETTGTFANSFFPPNFVLPSADASARLDWYGTARARVGWANGSFLFYGTGGLAYGNVGLTNNYNLGTEGQEFSIGSLNGQISGVRVGWVAGAGVEYMINRNLSINLEYQYVDLGTFNQASLSAPPPFQTVTSPSATVHAQFQAVTIGLNWHFGAPPSTSSAYASMYTKAAPPPPSDPWAGLYVGGRAGGAWGNNLSITTPTRILPPPV